MIKNIMSPSGKEMEFMDKINHKYNDLIGLCKTCQRKHRFANDFTKTKDWRCYYCHAKNNGEKA